MFFKKKENPTADKLSNTVDKIVMGIIIGGAIGSALGVKLSQKKDIKSNVIESKQKVEQSGQIFIKVLSAIYQVIKKRITKKIKK